MRVQAASCVAVWIAAIQIESEGFHRLAASCVFCILASTSDPAGPVHLGSMEQRGRASTNERPVDDVAVAGWVKNYVVFFSPSV